MAEQLPLLHLPDVDPMRHVGPLIKFPGSKRWLVPYIARGIWKKLLAREGTAREGARYIEPFAGSVAVGLDIGWPRTVAGDLLPDLIGLYRTVQRDPSAVADGSRAVCDRYAGQDTHSSPDGGYYGARREYNSVSWVLRDGAGTDPLAPRRAALLLYLNKRGYNGLVRVNAHGRWNVPRGKSASGEWWPAPPPFDPDRLVAFAAATCAWTFVCSDFAPLIDAARVGDAVFCDPPYGDPDKEQRATRMFTGYTPDGFTEADQARLADALARARDRGAIIVHTNADSEAIRALYRERGFWTIPTAELRAVNRDGEGRRRKPCLLVLSHPEVLDVADAPEGVEPPRPAGEQLGFWQAGRGGRRGRGHQGGRKCRVNTPAFGSCKKTLDTRFASRYNGTMPNNDDTEWSSVYTLTVMAGKAAEDADRLARVAASAAGDYCAPLHVRAATRAAACEAAARAVAATGAAHEAARTSDCFRCATCRRAEEEMKIRPDTPMPHIYGSACAHAAHMCEVRS